MKNLIAMALTFITLNGFAQNKSNTSANAPNKYKIDLYYGAPYLYINTLNDSAAVHINKITNTNHIGLRFEAMISDKLGGGFEYTYAKATINYQKTSTVTDSLGVVTTITKNYTDEIVKERGLLRVDFHFIKSKVFDPYVCVGGGYKQTTYYSNRTGTNKGEAYNLIPVSIRLGIGFRCFFTDNVGMSAEVGLGGPLAQAGVCFKW